MRLLTLVSLVCCLFSGPAAFGLQQSGAFEEATTAYNEGNYQEAISKYSEILENGQHSAALYFNLGNAHYKLGNIAPSIYFYEKALLLDPADPEIRNNLAFARNMTLDDIQPLPRTDIGRYYESVLYAMEMDNWARMGIVFMFLFVLGYILFYRLPSPNHKRLALIGALACLLLSLGFTALSYLQYQAYQADQPAIIFSEEVTVRSEPNDRSEQAFQLHEGTRVQVLDSLDRWNKIRIADGQIGWMPSEDLKRLKDF